MGIELKIIIIVVGVIALFWVWWTTMIAKANIMSDNIFRR